MLPAVSPLAHQLAWNDRLLPRLIDGFTPEDWWNMVADQRACWLVGHMTIKRRQMLTMIGLSLPSVVRLWEQSFRRDSPPASVSRNIVPAELVEAFHGLQCGIASHWSHVTAGDLMAPVDRPFPDGSRTVGTGLRYLVGHETYHLGQLGLLRRGLGRSAVSV